MILGGCRKFSKEAPEEQELLKKSLGRFDAIFLRYLRKLFARLQSLIGLL